MAHDGRAGEPAGWLRSAVRIVTDRHGARRGTARRGRTPGGRGAGGCATRGGRGRQDPSPRRLPPIAKPSGGATGSLVPATVRDARSFTRRGSSRPSWATTSPLHSRPMVSAPARRRKGAARPSGMGLRPTLPPTRCSRREGQLWRSGGKCERQSAWGAPGARDHDPDGAGDAAWTLRDRIVTQRVLRGPFRNCQVLCRTPRGAFRVGRDSLGG
jgi:hypothetical protein